MSLSTARWLAVPASAFGLALAGSFAYHSRGDESAAPPVDRPASAGPAQGGERIAFSLRGDAEGDSYLIIVALDGDGSGEERVPVEGQAAGATWGPGE